MKNKSTEKMIKEAGLTAPRVTIEHINGKINKVEYIAHTTPSGSILRWCAITMTNGFSVTGDPSASVSAENDNEEIGKKIAYANAYHKIWAFEGYLLAEKLSNCDSSDCVAIEPIVTLEEMTFSYALENLRDGDKIARKAWGKNVFIYYVEANAYPASNNSNNTMVGLYKDDLVPYQAYIASRTDDGTVVPWIPSQSDMLADDWVLVL